MMLSSPNASYLDSEVYVTGAVNRSRQERKRWLELCAMLFHSDMDERIVMLTRLKFTEAGVYPYVSIRFIILFFQGNEIAEDDMVIPLSRS